MSHHPPKVRSQRCLTQRSICFATAVFVFAAWPVLTAAQFVQGPMTFAAPPIYDWSLYDPYSRNLSGLYDQARLFNSQLSVINAQANFLNSISARNYSESVINLSEARMINAEAVAREIDNIYQANRTKWQIRLESKQFKMDENHLRQVEKMEYLNNRKWVNNRIWNKLENHPELNRSSVETGTALNFLLNRLSVSGLPINFNPNNVVFGPKAIQEMQINLEKLSGVRLRQGKVIFELASLENNDLEFWPHLLDADEFKQVREEYLQMRKTAFDEEIRLGSIGTDTVKLLDDSLQAFMKAFYESPNHTQVKAENQGFRYYGDVARFFKERSDELRHAKESKTIRPFSIQDGFDKNRDGENLVAFLAFMNRNGLEFAAPASENKAGYHHLFEMMRALYLEVSDQDESIKPEAPDQLDPTR